LIAKTAGALAKKSIDRRVVRTRGLLQNALVSLILKKGYQAVTVEDVCAEANVGRSTFYAHYKGKEDLHRSGMAQLRRQLLERQRTAAGSSRSAHEGLNFSLPVLEHARDHIDHYRAMVGHGGDAGVIGHIRKIVADLVRDEIASTKPSRETVPRELLVQYLVGAYMAVLTWWLDDGAKLPPEQIDAIFRGIANRGLTGFYAERSG
jgi:AcrR family transcriptional regulator